MHESKLLVIRLSVLGEAAGGHRHDIMRHPKRLRQALGYSRVTVEILSKTIGICRRIGVAAYPDVSSVGRGEKDPAIQPRSQWQAKVGVALGNPLDGVY